MPSIGQLKMKHIAAVLAVMLSLFQIIFTGGFAIMDSHLLRAIHLSAVMALIFMYFPGYREEDSAVKKNVLTLINIILVVLAFSSAYYVFTNLDMLQMRMRYLDEVTQQDMIYGVIAVLLVLETTRRTSGWSLVLIACAFIVYALFGHAAPFPEALRHSGVSFDALIEQLFMITDGIYGVPVAVSSTMIFAFVMFGAFLHVSGMSSVFMDLACLLTRKSRGGPAKVAIFASALFGTISGSAPANVYGTGTFTIPLMKRVGYSPAFAGAVEAVASTGGQIMPPIMGAAAFIMADLTGTGYIQVAKAALLPAILYYLSLWTMIHFEAVRHNLGTLPKDQIPDSRQVISRLYYLLPIFGLIIAMVLGRSVISCAFIATLAIIILSLFRAETRMTPARLWKALEMSAKNCLMITSCCACAGIIIGVIAITGIGFTFISAITDLAGNNLFLLMVMLTLTSIVLGMGVPTTPAYVIVATLGAPALIKAGVPALASHMFVFYYAILSVITPPVCMAAFAGASIAEANAMRTGLLSSKLGIVAFIIPFMFVYEPALLLSGSLPETSLACVSAIIGVIALAGGMQQWFLILANRLEQLLLLAGGLSLIYPGLLTDMIGACCIVSVVLMQLVRKKRTASLS
ncbi:TRAP transporter permease [Mailhella massiliensis]|uniref:TRAP transporter permease n=1 Tax=Mailhella massiliensis TaxID=1903261 RepID=UPI0023F31B3C|nr:TRAP transporter permease [Mailhella massiliensis]